MKFIIFLTITLLAGCTTVQDNNIKQLDIGSQNLDDPNLALFAQFLNKEGIVNDVEEFTSKGFKITVAKLNGGSFSGGKNKKAEFIKSGLEGEKIIVEANNIMAMSIDKSSGIPSVSASILNKNLNNYVQVIDIDGNGLPDFLRYYVLDKNGEDIFRVEDYGFDGQADVKWDIQNNLFKVYYNKEWHLGRRTDKSKPMYFLIDGHEISISEMIELIERSTGMPK
jgi:hypothetical protein